VARVLCGFRTRILLEPADLPVEVHLYVLGQPAHNKDVEGDYTPTDSMTHQLPELYDTQVCAQRTEDLALPDPSINSASRCLSLFT
jgi:hypothetical protein